MIKFDTNKRLTRVGCRAQSAHIVINHHLRAFHTFVFSMPIITSEKSFK